MQDILNRQAKVNKDGSIGILSDFLKCKCCGGNMIKRTSKERVYYYCSNYYRNKTCENNESISENKLIEIINEKLNLSNITRLELENKVKCIYIDMDNKNLQITNHDFLIYRDSNNDIKVSVMLINNDIWLTQNLIAELFGVGRSTITEHINNILNSGELDENNTVGKTDIDNSKKPVKIYNLDMIIAVGYRVNSKKATNFRIWATKILKEYMIKGVVMDDERLKNPNYIFGEDYFEETLERIRNIRSSERRFYQKITDIYSSCSVDYDKDSEITKEFFKTVQNKLHYAITGNTAAEIIYNRVDSEKENMGLTNWKNSPDGPIYKYDVDIAKNYLNEKELKDLNRIVTMYLDYAELQAENHNAMTMKDWVEKLNAFLQFNDKEILCNAGKISASVAKELAYKEYDKFKVKQDKLYKSDFDNFLNETRMIENGSDK